MQLYTQSTATIMIILGFVVWYILSLLETAQERSQTLLFNMMPAAIAQRLIDAPQRRVAERHADTTVMFADLCGFTRLMATLDAGAVVDLLNDIFSELDALTEHYKVEKIKTIGDAYMVCAGVPVARADHAEAVAALALDIVAVIDKFAAAHKLPLKIRIGIESGSVVAGVIGASKFSYDVWGDTVNLAARLEAQSEHGQILVCEKTELYAAGEMPILSVGSRDIRGFGSRDVFAVDRSKTDVTPMPGAVTDQTVKPPRVLS